MDISFCNIWIQFRILIEKLLNSITLRINFKLRVSKAFSKSASISMPRLSCTSHSVIKSYISFMFSPINLLFTNTFRSSCIIYSSVFWCSLLVIHWKSFKLYLIMLYASSFKCNSCLSLLFVDHVGYYILNIRWRAPTSDILILPKMFLEIHNCTRWVQMIYHFSYSI